MKKLLASFLLLSFYLLPSISHAQTMEDVKAQMLKDWTRAKAYTTDYLNTMPAGKYGFKAVDSIRSFAQQMLHLAAGNCFLISNATDDQPPSWLGDIEHRPGAQNKDSVMYYVMASYDFCANAVKNSAVSKWWEKKKMFNNYEETRFALMNKTFEHQTHHRGQTTIYIRLQGITPPNERLF
jgi:DinB family